MSATIVAEIGDYAVYGSVYGALGCYLLEINASNSQIANAFNTTN